MPVEPIKTEEEYINYINADRISVVLFTAAWSDQCQHVEQVLNDLSNICGHKLQINSIEAESFPKLSLKHEIEAVPTVIFFKNGSATDRIDGVNIALLTAKCKEFASVSSDNSEIPLNDRLKALTNKAPLMIFMKGDRDAPRCGFSKQLVGIINEMGVPYETFDILTDEEVRQGLKTYSNWPTYPQVYVKGELIGGLDIIKELKESNELESALKG